MKSIYAIYRTAGYVPGSGTIANYTEGKKVEAGYIAWFAGYDEAKRAQIAQKEEYMNQYRVEELTQEDCEELGFLAVYHSLTKLLI